VAEDGAKTHDVDKKYPESFFSQRNFSKSAYVVDNQWSEISKEW
jgi:hypothetical protein